MMRVLVLSKRRYMGKDLLGDQYGRYFDIPEELVKRGHEVKGLALAYREKGTTPVKSGLANWSSHSLLPFAPLALVRYLRQVRLAVEEFSPDVIWAGSDALHSILGANVGRSLQIPCVIDLYDNYESFRMTHIPGLNYLLKRSCRQTNALTVVGARLKLYLATNYGVDANSIHVLQNAVRTDLFRRMDRQVARKTLGLPESGRLIGTAGALTANRGIEVLFDAFLSIAHKYKDLYLVVAGQRDSSISKFRHERIIDLGQLPLESVPQVFNALNVAVICNKQSSFGEYCFPQKFYEIVACRTPVVSADVGEMRDLLAEHQELLFRADSSKDLEQAILKQLECPTPLIDIQIPTWSTRAIALENIFESVT